MDKSTSGSWVYLKSEPGLWTVGFYAPDGKWNPERDYNIQEEAARRVAWLNGGAEALPELVEALKQAWSYFINRPGNWEVQLEETLRAALAKLEGKL